MRHFLARGLAATVVAAALVSAQVQITRPLPPSQQPTPAPPAPQPRPATPAAPARGAQTPAAQAQAAQPGQAPGAQTEPATAAAPLADNGAFMVPGASLSEMIDILARRLKLNIIIDPRVKGTVTIYTYGEVKPVDYMQLLQTILRVNGATMVQVGDLYRIIPISLVPQMPLSPTVNADPKTLPDDERMILNLIFLKYATASEIDKLIAPFLGENAAHSVYDPANLLIIQDNSRNMKRTMDLIAMFDSDTFAGQRVRLFDVSNSRPSDLVKDLDQVFKAYSLADKSGAVRFIPIDRINTLIAVAPNPGIFTQVEDWIKKLDVAVKLPAGATNNYVYRLKYGQAATVAMAIMALYTGNVGALIGMAAQANAGMVSSGMGYGALGYGGVGMGVPGLPYGGVPMGMPGVNSYAGGGSPYGSAYGNPYGSSYGSPYGANYGYAPAAPAAAASSQGAATAGQGVPSGNIVSAPGSNQTGSYLGYPGGGYAPYYQGPRVVPNPFDNTLLIQATPQEYEQLVNLLQQLDVAPRQVLIEAKIYEVDLTGAFAAGVSSYLQSKDTPPSTGLGRTLNASSVAASGVSLTTGALVLRNSQLLAFLNASENQTNVHVVSSPSIIATDGVPATMNVGDQVPVLTSQAASNVQQGGSSLFTNNISTASSGTTLSIVANINSSGVVTMVINQQVSSPEPAPPGASDASTSFQNRSVSTQVTVKDGQTVAISGIITDKRTESSGGVPVLHRIPLLGAAFGAKSTTSSRTELIILLTPRVIYDTTQIDDASDELKSSLKRVQKMMRRDGIE